MLAFAFVISLLCLCQGAAVEGRLELGRRGNLEYHYGAGDGSVRITTLERSNTERTFVITASEGRKLYPSFVFSADWAPINTYVETPDTWFFWHSRKGLWGVRDSTGLLWYLHFHRNKEYPFTSPGKFWFYYGSHGKIKYGDIKGRHKVLHLDRDYLHDPSHPEHGFISFSCNQGRITGFSYTGQDRASKIIVNDYGAVLLFCRGINGAIQITERMTINPNYVLSKELTTITSEAQVDDYTPQQISEEHSSSARDSAEAVVVKDQQKVNNLNPQNIDETTKNIAGILVFTILVLAFYGLNRLIFG